MLLNNGNSLTDSYQRWGCRLGLVLDEGTHLFGNSGYRFQTWRLEPAGTVGGYASMLVLSGWIFRNRILLHLVYEGCSLLVYYISGSYLGWQVATQKRHQGCLLAMVFYILVATWGNRLQHRNYTRAVYLPASISMRVVVFVGIASSSI
jgi:hypothetical protein